MEIVNRLLAFPYDVLARRHPNPAHIVIDNGEDPTGFCDISTIVAAILTSRSDLHREGLVPFDPTVLNSMDADRFFEVPRREPDRTETARFAQDRAVVGIPVPAHDPDIVQSRVFRAGIRPCEWIGNHRRAVTAGISPIDGAIYALQAETHEVFTGGGAVAPDPHDEAASFPDFGAGIDEPVANRVVVGDLTVGRRPPDGGAQRILQHHAEGFGRFRLLVVQYRHPDLLCRLAGSECQRRRRHGLEILLGRGAPVADRGIVPIAVERHPVHGDIPGLRAGQRDLEYRFRGAARLGHRSGVGYRKKGGFIVHDRDRRLAQHLPLAFRVVEQQHVEFLVRLVRRIVEGLHGNVLAQFSRREGEHAGGFGIVAAGSCGRSFRGAVPGCPAHLDFLFRRRRKTDAERRRVAFVHGDVADIYIGPRIVVADETGGGAPPDRQAAGDAHDLDAECLVVFVHGILGGGDLDHALRLARGYRERPAGLGYVVLACFRGTVRGFPGDGHVGRRRHAQIHRKFHDQPFGGLFRILDEYGGIVGDSDVLQPFLIFRVLKKENRIGMRYELDKKPLFAFLHLILVSPHFHVDAGTAFDDRRYFPVRLFKILSRLTLPSYAMARPEYGVIPVRLERFLPRGVQQMRSKNGNLALDYQSRPRESQEWLDSVVVLDRARGFEGPGAVGEVRVFQAAEAKHDGLVRFHIGVSIDIDGNGLRQVSRRNFDGLRRDVPDIGRAVRRAGERVAHVRRNGPVAWLVELELKFQTVDGLAAVKAVVSLFHRRRADSQDGIIGLVRDRGERHQFVLASITEDQTLRVVNPQPERFVAFVVVVVVCLHGNGKSGLAGFQGDRCSGLNVSDIGLNGVEVIGDRGRTRGIGKRAANGQIVSNQGLHLDRAVALERFVELQRENRGPAFGRGNVRYPKYEAGHCRDVFQRHLGLKGACLEDWMRRFAQDGRDCSIVVVDRIDLGGHFQRGRAFAFPESHFPRAALIFAKQDKIVPGNLDIHHQIAVLVPWLVELQREFRRFPFVNGGFSRRDAEVGMGGVGIVFYGERQFLVAVFVSLELMGGRKVGYLHFHRDRSIGVREGVYLRGNPIEPSSGLERKGLLPFTGGREEISRVVVTDVKREIDPIGGGRRRLHDNLGGQHIGARFVSPFRGFGNLGYQIHRPLHLEDRGEGVEWEIAIWVSDNGKALA